MPLESVTLDNAIKLAIPIAKKLFKSKIVPLITVKVKKYFSNNAALKKFENESVKYISQLVGKCSTMNTIAFQNSPKRLEDLYVPLTLSDGDEDANIKVDDGIDIFDKNNHILLVDSAGMGKSTLSKKVILNTVDQDVFIPVYVELREVDNRSMDMQIAERFGFSSDNPSKFLSQFPFLYVFDGLDEVESDIQKEVIKSINKFSNYFSESRILVTSRYDSFLADFYDFKRYSISKLEKSEAFSLLEKSDPAGEISKKLISGINNSEDPGIRDFLSTPLYVSLLFCSYRHKTIIPQKKHLFYLQVYDALFESHDLSKDVGYVRPKYSKLDSAEFHSVLRKLGFWCLKNNGKIEFQKDELEIIVADIISKISGVESSASCFLKDITTTVPLFVKEGVIVRWSHKSLMEYFASMFICNDSKSRQGDLLLYLFSSDKWSSYSNIFELCADIDYGTFRSSIVKSVLEKFLLYCENNYKNIINKRISHEKIFERISLSFSLGVSFSCLDEESLKSIFEKSFRENIYPETKGNYGYTTSSLFPLARGFSLYVMSASGREKFVLNIIRYKSPSLFLNDDISYSFLDEIISSSIKNGVTYVVNDNPQSIFNNSANFNYVNELLWIVSKNALDKDAVEMELKKIDDDCSDGVDHLLGDLIQ